MNIGTQDIRLGIIGGTFKSLYGYNQNLYEYKKIILNINKLLIKLNSRQTLNNSNSTPQPTSKLAQYYISSLMFSDKDGIDYLTYQAYEKSRNLLTFPYKVIIPSNNKQTIRDRFSIDLHNRLIRGTTDIIKIYSNTTDDYIYNQCNIVIIIDSLKNKGYYNRFLNTTSENTKVFFIDSHQIVSGITKEINTITKSIQDINTKEV